MKKILLSLTRIPYQVGMGVIWLAKKLVWLAKKLLKLGNKIVKFSKPFAKQALKKFNKLKPKQKIIFGAVAMILIVILGFSFNKAEQASAPQQTTFKKNLVGKWDYSTPKNQAGIKTKLSKNKTGLLVQVLRNKSQLEFALPLDNPSLVVAENKASYLNQDKSIEVTYEVQPDRLKESIILHKPTTQTNFTSNILLKNLVIKMSKQENLPVFFDTDNNYEFHLERPFAIDAAGNQTYAVSYSFRPKTSGLNQNPFKQTDLNPTSNSPANTISSKGNLLENSLEEITVETNEYDLIITVDQTWLKDPIRQYPITIDPTVVHDTTAEFATGEFNRLIDTGSGSSPVLETYYQELPADEHTIGLWHMNEASDNTCGGGEDVCDASGAGNHGTFYNNATFTGSGRIGADSLSFDGIDDATDDYLLLNNTDTIGTKTTFSLEAWVNINDATDTDSIYAEFVSSTGRSRAYFAINNGLINFDQYDPTGGPVEGNTLVSANEWHHVAYVQDGVNWWTYLDGKIDNSDSTAEVYSGGTPNKGVIGARAYDSQSGGFYRVFDGELDELRISNIARTPEEIRASASRKPYAVYTSPVVDFTNNTSSWNPLTWTEAGVATGDGETVFSNTSLVAQWNFNETSGTTANNDAEGTSCGGTPANCDGTLVGFDSTASQDADPDSSWTANNKKWGAGALQFDGTDSYISFGANRFSPLLSGASDATLEAWIKPSSFPGGTSRDRIISVMSADGVTGASISLYGDNQIEVGGRSATGDSFETARAAISNLNQWHHVVGVLDFANDTIYAYVDGILMESSSVTFANTTYIPGTPSADLDTIGSLDNTADFYNGVIDAPRIYSRALTANEITSNYNASNLQFQTRVGATATPNDGTWDAWSPTTNEAQLEALDDNSPVSKISQTNLISHWKLDETSGSRSDSIGSNTLTDNATVTYGAGRLNSAGYFNDANSEYLSVTDNSTVSSGDIELTVAGWVKADSFNGSGPDVIAGKWNSAGSQKEYLLQYESSSNRFQFHFSDNSTQAGVDADSLGVPSIGQWYFVVGWHDPAADTLNIQVNNGAVDSTAWSSGGNDGTAEFTIGAYEPSGPPAGEWDGHIDEVTLWKRILTADERTQLFMDGSDILNKPGHGGLYQTIDTSIKNEGTGSEKITVGKPLVDGHTVGFWHLDETNGDNGGDDVFDETANNLDGEFNGTNVATAVTDGIVSKARDFNGTDDYVSIPTSTTLDLTGDFTLEAWVNLDSNSGVGRFISRRAGEDCYALVMNSNKIGLRIGDVSCSTTLGNTVITTDTWHHIAGTYVASSGLVTVYLDGEYDGSATDTDGPPVISGALAIGSYYLGNQWWVDGQMDEVKISNVARTAEEMAETYRMGRDHFINKTISSTDLSDDNQVAFDIAADRPGTYLETIIGESAFANYQPDTNTVGLWHLDEGTDDACDGGNSDACDASGNGNHGDVTSAPPIVQGIRGKARDFDGSADYIDLSSSGTAFDFANTTFSIEGWVKSDSSSQMGLFAKGGTNASLGYEVQFNASAGRIAFAWGNAGGASSVYATDTGWNDGSWHHVAVVATTDTSTAGNNDATIYLDGVVLSTTDSATYIYTASSSDPTIGARDTGGSDFFDGVIDEVRISDTARTTDEIRQTYEIGRRSHPITIDFAALLDSGNLITGSGDTGFTVDATAYGLEQKGDAVYTGNKIIVRETIDATEYIAQGTVTAVTASTGAVTVDSWDSGSTFPSGGYTANASVFKWQREYFDLSGPLSSHINATTNLTFRVTNGHEGRTVWIDDLISAGDYLTTDTGSTILSNIGYRYLQYRTIFSSSDEFVSSLLSTVALDYEENVTVTAGSPTACYLSESRLDDQIAIHWTDNSSDELSFEIEKRIDGGTWTTLDLTSPDAQTYNDDSISSGYTYQYRVRNVAESTNGEWCTTSVVDLNTGSFQIEGLKIEGIRLD